jgi:PRC-barrel domain
MPICHGIAARSSEAGEWNSVIVRASQAYPGTGDGPLTRSITLTASAALLAIGLAAPAMSQGAPQTVALMKVDPQTLATGYRSSKIVGASVINETHETVGAIDDLIVTSSEKVPFAVLSVGGFLGLGTKYVVVPFSSLQLKDKQSCCRVQQKTRSRRSPNSSTPIDPVSYPLRGHRLP